MPESYEAEQERLRAKYGYEGDGDSEEDFEVNYQVPEVNPEIYKDMESLLFKGFVVQPAKIHGVNFVFKSLNHHEFKLLEMLYDTSDPEGLEDYYAMFLSLGVLYLDHINMLVDRDKSLGELRSYFSEVEPPVKQLIIHRMSEINRRANRAILLTEPYCMEAQSRMKWAQNKGLDLMSPSITGIRGTDTIGLNFGQLLWRAINHFEDLKENAEREWENAKFIASSMAGKGMQKVYNSDKRRRQSEIDEKVARREKVINYAVFGTPMEGASEQGSMVVAKTVGDLAKQLENDLKGEQDWHDKVISEYIEKARQGHLDRMAKISQLREEHQKNYGDKVGVLSSTQMGLSEADVQERIRKSRADAARNQERLEQFPELLDASFEERSSKWLQEPEPIIQHPSSATPSAPRAKPFNGGR